MTKDVTHRILTSPARVPNQVTHRNRLGRMDVEYYRTLSTKRLQSTTPINACKSFNCESCYRTNKHPAKVSATLYAKFKEQREKKARRAVTISQEKNTVSVTLYHQHAQGSIRHDDDWVTDNPGRRGRGLPHQDQEPHHRCRDRHQCERRLPSCLRACSLVHPARAVATYPERLFRSFSQSVSIQAVPTLPLPVYEEEEEE